MKIRLIVTLAILSFACFAEAHSDHTIGQTIDLSGKWRFEIEQNDKGQNEAWFNKTLEKKINLPGSMSENGYGKYGSPGKLGVPGWAAWNDKKIWHPVLRKDYRGAAWYQRDIVVPDSWKSDHLRLFLERSCWVSDLWVDDRHIGQKESLSAPHIYEIGELTPGKHRLSIRIDNRQLHYLGCNTHAYHEQSVTIFNGIIGRIELSARPKVFIAENQVFADPDTGLCKYRLKIKNQTKEEVSCSLAANVNGVTSNKTVRIKSGESTVETTVLFPKEKIKRWSEFRQPLYTAQATLKSPYGDDKLAVKFGFRKLETKGHQFLVNGKPVLMRGEASNGMFPLTGYPPMTIQEWRKIFKTYKSFGLNHLRCHSWTPPEAAFLAGDELGVFILPELPNGETAVHDEKGNPWRKKEFFEILDTYGNHPSFAFMSNGNEAKTRKVAFFIDLVNQGKKHDSRHLYTMMSNPEASGDGNGFNCDEYLVSHQGKGGKRRLETMFNNKMPNTISDYRNTMPRDIPYISHETGQWYVYPDVSTIKKYTGVIEPRNLIEFKRLLKKNELLAQADEFVDASGRLSLLLYKEEIEHSLRTPQYGGFQLLGLQDSYDQGSAFVGQIDNFFDPKPYVSAQKFKRFCGPEVPLARFEKRVWLNNETFTANIELANYGAKTLQNKTVSWSLTNGSHLIKKAAFNPMDIPNTGLNPIGKISCQLNSLHKATKMKLTIKVEGTSIANDWDLWVYPAQLKMPKTDGLIITNNMTPEIEQKLNQGAKVVFLPSGFKSTYTTAMTPPFWSPMMFQNQKQNVGFLVKNNHPALKQFPTDSYNNWQWWELTFNGAAADLSALGSECRPIVQGIDHPNRCRRLGIIYEGKVGKGKLLVCTLDLNFDLEKRPVARQLRYSLLSYASSNQFRPTTEMALDGNRPVSNRRSLLLSKRLVKKISADSEHENNWANFAVDGNIDTIWHTRWDDTQTPHPHELTIELKTAITIKGIIQTPRKGEDNGQIAKYRIHVSNDNKTWKVVASGKWEVSDRPQKALFKKPITCKYIKLEALSEVNGKPWTSVAELDVIQ